MHSLKYWLILWEQNIVADMRKVLAKNPQVEQQRLHRRVFLENVDRENQALLVSCSVITICPHHLLTYIDHMFILLALITGTYN